MTKPVVFFSHSSSDKKLLAAIKDLFIQKTGGSVEVFLSSDGSSIKFGKNWLSEVESALDRAQLMFVFMTENSLASRWIHFEAGHAYAKNIRVIPVCLGVDLSVVGAPLNILQGFNVINESGLNNLIAIINDQFNYQHAIRFTSEEYLKLTDNRGISGEVLCEISGLIKRLSLKATVSPQDGRLSDKELSDRLFCFLKEKDIECRVENSLVECQGMSVVCRPGDRLGDIFEFVATIYPSCLSRNFELLEQFLNTSGFARVDRSIIFEFIREVVALQEKHVLTGKLGREIRFHDKDSFAYKNVVFNLSDIFRFDLDSVKRLGCSLCVRPKKTDLSISEVYELLGLLFESGIIKLEE